MPNTVPDTLSKDDVALLCDIGEYDPDANDANKRQQVEQLVAGGYLERADDPILKAEKYQLTRKAQTYLVERGVGLNEA